LFVLFVLFDLVILVTKMDSLPVEIVDMILWYAKRNRHMELVCMFVCKSWYNMVRPGQPVKKICYYVDTSNSVPEPKWLHNDRCPWNSHACKSAARKGDLAVLQWLHNHGWPITVGVYCCAAARGHIHILQWLRDNGHNCDGTVCVAAAQRERLDVLQWLHARGYPWHSQTLPAAAGTGNIEMLQWLRANGCIWGVDIYTAAARGGHLPVLQWLHENGYPIQPMVCNLAAVYGYLDILRWMYTLGNFRSDEICYHAVCNGHLEVLQWAVANGCSHGPSVYLSAGKYPHILQWLYDAGHINKTNISVYQFCESNCLPGVKWTHKHGYSWNELCTKKAAKCGNLKMLKYLYKNGCPLNKRACKIAVGRRALKIVYWLDSI
jgi:hypothetical protein